MVRRYRPKFRGAGQKVTSVLRIARKINGLRRTLEKANVSTVLVTAGVHISKMAKKGVAQT